MFVPLVSDGQNQQIRLKFAKVNYKNKVAEIDFRRIGDGCISDNRDLRIITRQNSNLSSQKLVVGTM